ncbi:helix-turn-helix transcriptional regulator [Streptomyces aurantiacus]|uniref:Transcriptional regulator n=1 Tax=Streptomyces aurantiacus TaxID=47760 RepID=A0A7G1PAN9_9ACTN|nr:helix-turn-helix transcriptional regulator [Streptomyces aurantiacus]MDQ0779095.1 transcriptional regulator with XRE-family HTH domain [Streptomyces aurantiacus]BCL32468.1 transcriptional regulator [Streptomyces aurantiacus]
MTDASAALSDDPRRELAEFLRTRRTRLRPQDVGLEPGPRRRVAGLRREELALLAGVSSDYYQRMEQGRDVRPSEQVLDALARALNFSAEESRHLHSLAAAARTPARSPRPYVPEEVPDTTLRLLRTMTSPALVVGRFLDVLAWTPLAGALLGEFTHQPQARRNLLSLFLNPEADQVCPKRAATVAELTGMLRTQVAADPGNPRAVELVGELAVRSDEFAALWARHDVEEPVRGQMRIDHPLVGELNLDWDAYPIPGNPGPVLFVCTAAENSPDAERLQLLAGLLSPGPPSRP